VTAPTTPLLIVGDPAAAACEGDFCAVPGQDAVSSRHAAPGQEQALVNRRLDADLV
jgi:hypothetical protein